MPFPSPKSGPLPKQNSRMSSISSDRSRLRRSYLLQIQKQGSIKVFRIIILVYCIQSYSRRTSTKSYFPRVYQEYEKANSKTGEFLR